MYSSAPFVKEHLSAAQIISAEEYADFAGDSDLSGSEDRAAGEGGRAIMEGG